MSSKWQVLALATSVWQQKPLGIQSQPSKLDTDEIPKHQLDAGGKGLRDL